MTHQTELDSPGDLTCDFSVKRTPTGAVFTLKCSTCGAKLGSFIVGNAKSKLPAGWWKCPNGCNEDVERLDA
jgi:hypothetical protein